MQNNAELILAGQSTDHIWVMKDGPESHPIGIRMDCGDSGAVYVSKAQARDLAEQLLDFLDQIAKLEAEAADKELSPFQQALNKHLHRD